MTVAGLASCNLSLEGPNGAVLATSRSGQDGRFNFDVETKGAEPTGLARLRAESCTYSDEFTGETLTGARLSTVFALPEPFDGSKTVLAVTPLTRLIDAELVSRAGTDAVGTLNVEALNDLTASLSTLISDRSDAVLTTLPAVAVDVSSASADEDARDYGLLLAALSAMGDLDAALETLDFDGDALSEAARESVLDAAARFEMSGRNVSGKPAPVALGALVGKRMLGNSAPQGPSQRQITVQPGTILDADLMSGFEDADGDRLELRVSGLPEGLRIEGGRLHGEASASADFAVTVFDGRGGAAYQIVRLTVSGSTPPSVPGNRAPVAVADSVVLPTTTAAREVAVTANDTDADGDALSVTEVSDVGVGIAASIVGRNVRVVGKRPGTWGLLYRVEDGRGGSDTARLTVEVPQPSNLPPVAVLNNADRTVELGKASLFRGPNSSDPDGQIVAWRWEMGDGMVRTQDSFNYTYAKTGSYTVKLTVTDDDGATGSATGKVTVTEPPRKSVAMPVEVLGTGAPGTTTIKAREFTLASANGVERIALTCHRCDYRDSGTNLARGAKASIRVNGGDWVDVTDAIADVAEPEKSYGGIIGAYHTVRFTMPVTGLLEGDNRVEFRFNGTDGFTNGYRIIKLNLLDTAGREVLPEGDFVWDDPTTWQPPRNTAGDIQNGKVALRESPLSDMTMLASCSSCHASDGSDLKYFNYSNATIKVRAQFHGLSGAQGERIASYIRALPSPNPKQARPWNPPYQPGPGLDAKPVEEWAAGAGLEAVLDRDQDMLADMFPNGTSDAELRRVTSTRNTINVREQRIALQLPDWKMWLPEVHPIDLFGEDWETLFKPDFTFEGMMELLRTDRERMITQPDSIRRQELIELVNDLGAVRGLIGQRGPQPCLNASVYRSPGYKRLVENGFITRPAVGADADDGVTFELPPDLATNPDACETWSRSIAHWKGVKEWEIHTRFGLEDVAPELYPYGEVRSWLGNERAVFEIAPHRSGNDSKNFLHMTTAESAYASHAWYQLQVILNAGNRNPQNHTPPDWKYQMNWLWANRRENDVPSSLRYVQTLIKMQQNLDMRAPVEQPGGAPDVPDYMPFREDRGPTQNGWWTTTHVGPQRFVTIGGSFFTVDEDRPKIWRELDDIEPGLRRKVQDTMLRDYIDKTLTYAIEDFPRANGTSGGVSGPDEIPTPYSGKGQVSSSKTDHDTVYRSIPMMREFGMSETQIDRLIDWGEQMWPLGDWDALRRP